MIASLIVIYCVILHLIFNVFKWVETTTRNKIIVTVVGICLIIPLWYVTTFNQPQSNDVRVIRYAIQVVPRVTGRVVEVAARENTPLKKGDLLFKIDPRPYKFKLQRLVAELNFEELRLRQAQDLASKNAGRVFDVQRREAQVKSLNAQIEGARLDLSETTVYAPADGFVTNLTLVPGFVVSPGVPTMNFIYTRRTIVGATFRQQKLEKARIGDPVEIAFDLYPGKIFEAKVKAINKATGSGYVSPSEPLRTLTEVAARERFFVHLELTNKAAATSLPSGAGGAATIYSSAGFQATAMIRRVTIRFYTYFNYVLDDG